MIDPATGDLKCKIGNDFWVRPCFRDANLDPYSLVGKILVFTCQLSGSNKIRKQTDLAGSTFTITNAANGQTELFMPYTETRLIPAGSWNYTIELWTPPYQISLAVGKLIVTADTNDDSAP